MLRNKVIGIFLFVCLVVPVTATFMWLQYQKTQIRKEVKNNLIASMDREDFILLKFSQEEAITQLHWEHDKEFEYNGQMYDVVASDLYADTIYYWCWWDHEETTLNKKLDQLFALVLGNDTNRKDTQNLLNNYLKSLFLHDIPDWQTTKSQSESKSNKFHFVYLMDNSPPPLPPPEIG